MTRNGVEYDLPKSPYIVNYEDYTFFFSSKRYQDKFTEGVDSYIEEMGIKESKRRAITIIPEILGRIDYYYKVERRGFYIEKEHKPLRKLNI